MFIPRLKSEFDSEILSISPSIQGTARRNKATLNALKNLGFTGKAHKEQRYVFEANDYEKFSQALQKWIPGEGEAPIPENFNGVLFDKVTEENKLWEWWE